MKSEAPFREWLTTTLKEYTEDLILGAPRGNYHQLIEAILHSIDNEVIGSDVMTNHNTNYFGFTNRDMNQNRLRSEQRKRLWGE